MTVVLVEHRLERLSEVCPRLVALVAGRLLFDGSPRAAFNSPAVRERVGMPVYTRLALAAELPAPLPVTLTDASAAFRGTRG